MKKLEAIEYNIDRMGALINREWLLPDDLAGSKLRDTHKALDLLMERSEAVAAYVEELQEIYGA